MARAKHQDGWVEKTGTKTRTWTGYYYVYVGGKRKQRTKVLGLRAKMTKGQAEDALRIVIRPHEAADGVGVAIQLGATATFADACALYQKNKIDSGAWCGNNAKNMRSVFKNNIVKPLGKFKPDQLVTSFLQTWINGVAGVPEKGVAKKGACKDIVHKAYTHTKAVLRCSLRTACWAKIPCAK